MKTLTLYMITDNVFEYELLSHLAIEYYYNCVLNDNIILEKYGVYDDCIELTKFLDNKIAKILANNKNEFTYKKSDLTQFKNIFFNTITLKVFNNSNTDSADYTPTDSNNILIKVYVKKYIKNDIIDLIVHELMHAYIDNILKSKGIDTYKKIVNSTYYKTISEKDTCVKTILYICHTEEISPFIALIKTELHKNNSKIKNPIDALKVLKSSPVYQAYQFINNILDNYLELSVDIKEDITKEYNEICKTKYDSNTVYNKLKKRINKVNNKLRKILPKMCLEYLDNDKYTIKENLRDFITHL